MQCSFQKCSLRFRKLLSLGKSSSISLNTPDSYTMCSVCWRRCTLQHCTSTPAEAVQAAQVLAEAWKNSRKKHRLHGYYENTVKQIEKLLNILIHVHNMSYVCISMCIYKYIYLYSQSSLVIIANFQNMFIHRITLVVQFVKKWVDPCRFEDVKGPWKPEGWANKIEQSLGKKHQKYVQQLD